MKTNLSSGIIAILFIVLSVKANAWDGKDWNPTTSSHTYMAEYAVTEARQYFPEVGEYSKQLIEGANTELHELKIKPSESVKLYCADLETRRKSRYLGTNPGCDRPDLIWVDVLSAYKAGKKGSAYFLLGILLHEIEDMAAPAHAHNVYHQGNPVEFDNFEMMSLTNWKPDFTVIERRDPKFNDPSSYYKSSKSWCLEDAPVYKDRSTFSKTWALASEAERALLSKRQAAACFLSQWALESAMIAFERESKSQPVAEPSSSRQVALVPVGSGPGRIRRWGTPTSCGSEKVIRIWVNGKEVVTSEKNENDLPCVASGGVVLRATVWECLKQSWKDYIEEHKAELLDEKASMIKWAVPSEGIAESTFECISETCEWSVSDSACKELDYKTSVGTAGVCPASLTDQFTVILPEHPERAMVRGNTTIHYMISVRVDVKGRRTVKRTDGSVKTFETNDMQTVTVEISAPTPPGRPDLYGS
ncbi:MAG: hypothetical protein ACYC2Y_04490 [Armatimonadota bacterium]